MKDNSMKEAVEKLFSIPRFTEKPSLLHTRELLKKLGVYDVKAKIIHVAGTNGKGSVCNYLREALLKSNLKVGMFTSPHLVNVNERININGEDISDEEFLAAYEKVFSVADETSTFFEYVLAIAMVAFAGHELDYLILETGMGGSLDQTNVFEDKALSVITKIGYDHMQYLGNTIEEIAAQKAGIIGPWDAVYLDFDKAVTGVIESRIKKFKAMSHPIKASDIRIASIRKKCIEFFLRDEYDIECELKVHSDAAYQAQNVSLVYHSLQVLKKSDERIVIPKEFVSSWAGRMEEILPEVYVDGAHNDDGIDSLIECVKLHKRLSDRAFVLFFSVVSDKNYRDMIKRLCESKLFSKVYVTDIEGYRKLDPKVIADTFAGFCVAARVIDDKGAFCEKIKEESLKNRVYVTGSLYLVGEIKSEVKGRL